MTDKRPRVVFDTSVVVSIAGRPSGNYATWKAVLEGRLLAFTSEDAINELKDVLSRRQIHEHYGASLHPENVKRFIAGYRALATVLVNVPEKFILQDDPKDSPLFNLAIAERHLI